MRSSNGNTCLLTMHCIVADHENYREYLPFLRELHEHDDESVRSLMPDVLSLHIGAFLVYRVSVAVRVKLLLDQ